MRRMSGVLLTVTGFLACPCHLIVTLPLLASLLTGTVLGSFLTRNTGLVYTIAGIYFVVALMLGAWFLFDPARGSSKTDDTCPACVPLEPGEHRHSQSLIREELPATRRK
jgi:hypothetical protein